MLLQLVICMIASLPLYDTTTTVQIPLEEDTGIMPMNNGEGPYKTWFNRRLHTLDIWSKNDNDDPDLGQNVWYTMEYYMDGLDEAGEESHNSTETTALYYSWNLANRTAFTYLYFVNEPLSPETVHLEVTTNMFDIGNATIPLNTSEDYTKYTFKFNQTHIMMWVNDVMAIKLFLRDIPTDLGDTKYFKFLNMKADDKFKIYYWDPTVFCWTGGTEGLCYEDDLLEKFHFDREAWTNGSYTPDLLGDRCSIVNCTYEMLEKPLPAEQSEFARCVRLYHTEQGESEQRVLLKCTNEHYTYTACEQFPDNPCWYEVCDNFDLCNSAPPTPATLSLLLLTLLMAHLME